MVSRYPFYCIFLSAVGHPLLLDIASYLISDKKALSISAYFRWHGLFRFLCFNFGRDNAYADVFNGIFDVEALGYFIPCFFRNALILFGFFAFFRFQHIYCFRPFENFRRFFQLGGAYFFKRFNVFVIVIGA